MEDIFTVSLKFAVSLLAIADPLAAIPIFLATLAKNPSMNIKKLVNVVVNATCVTLIISLFLGQTILNFFGISIASFTIAGGFLLFGMAFSMMQAHSSDAKITDDEIHGMKTEKDVGVIPLAIPMLSGPGAISLSIIQSKKFDSLGYWIGGVIAVLFIGLLIRISFLYAKPIGEKIGQTGLNVMTRIMGLILLAISIEMVASGIKELLPALRGG